MSAPATWLALGPGPRTALRMPARIPAKVKAVLLLSRVRLSIASPAPRALRNIRAPWLDGLANLRAMVHGMALNRYGNASFLQMARPYQGVIKAVSRHEGIHRLTPINNRSRDKHRSSPGQLHHIVCHD